MKPETNVEQAVPFFAVADMARSVRYYVDGLGFALANQWVVEGKLRWCWLQKGGAALMLQEHRKEGLNAWQPTGKVGEGVTIYFTCRDALAIHREATARGIEAGRPFVGNGRWVTTMTDPDGYRLGFESPTDVPEGTVHAENGG